MFRAIVLCALYNLPDDQKEYQIRDRFSFMRFLGLGLEVKVPDAQTVWLYGDQPAQVKTRICLKKLTCNMRRLVQLERPATAGSP